MCYGLTDAILVILLHKVISNLDIYDIQFVNRQYHSAAFLHIIAAKNPPQGKKFEFLFTTNP